MNSIKNFLRALDIFGVNFSFRYKTKEKYQTSLGGFIIILFFIVVLVVGIYYFIPFINRKNYTIVYYAMNLAATEEVNLFDSNSNFAVGLNCETNKDEIYDVTDLLDLKSRYVLYIKQRDGTFDKDATNLVNHKCTYEDFYNKYDKQMDYMGVQNFECIADKTATIQGIFSDQVFSYFEFSVVAKNTSEDLMTKIEKFIFANDCKLQFVYTDIIIDLNNYEEPISQYINSIFIQLDPTLFIKRNIYFMNQYFTNDDYLMFVFGDGEKPETKPLYSRYEEYALYKGLDRTNNKVADYNYFSKIYIRADLKKTVITRKYQKFMEFYADASSLLIAVYEILVVIFNYVDTFYAHHSLSKIIFFFKELKDEDNFNIFKKNKKIEELLYMIDSNSSKRNSMQMDSKASSMNKFYTPSSKDSKHVRVMDKEEDEKDIQIYNNKKKISDGNPPKNSNLYEKNYEKIKSSNLKNSRKISNNNKTGNHPQGKTKDSEMDDFQRFKNNHQYSSNDSRNSKLYMNFKYKYNKENVNISESLGTSMEDESSSEFQQRKRKKKKNTIVENSFNVFEIPIVEFLKCCKTKSMSIKSDALEKANNILFNKLDIISYVRNMILYEITNKILLDTSQKSVINFLSRPIISVNKKQPQKQNEFSEFYKNYREKDFKKLYEQIQEISQKSKKEIMDSKLLNLSVEHLKDLV